MKAQKLFFFETGFESGSILINKKTQRNRKSKNDLCRNRREMSIANKSIKMKSRACVSVRVKLRLLLFIYLFLKAAFRHIGQLIFVRKHTKSTVLI